MSDDVDTRKMNLRPFTRRSRATADGNIGGTTVISLWDPAVPEGLNEADDYWRDGQILILTGDMRGQVREITDWSQANGTFTVSPRFTNPTASLLVADVGGGNFEVFVADASGFTAGDTAYLWDDLNAEEVTVILVDTTINMVRFVAGGPGGGLLNGYTMANNAAISVSPKILDEVQFTLMPPTKTVDTGEHTNPEQWLHDNHWNTAAEIPIVAAGAPGELALGAAVGAGVVRRIKEVTARHIGTNNTVVSILDQTGGNVFLSFDVPAQSTRIWSSQDGRAVAATLQPVVQTSDITGGGTTVSAAGVEE